MENIEISRKTTGSREFIEVVPDKKESIIEYELRMISINKIPGFLEVTHRQENENLVILYDITGKTSLEDRLKRGPLSKEETLNLMDAYVKAENNVREYQLSKEGIVVDEKYIYIGYIGEKSEIYVMYIPRYEKDSNDLSIGSMLMNMIEDRRINGGRDERFVPELKRLLNDSRLSIADIKEYVDKKKGRTQNRIQGRRIDTDSQYGNQQYADNGQYSQPYENNIQYNQQPYSGNIQYNQQLHNDNIQYNQQSQNNNRQYNKPPFVKKTVPNEMNNVQVKEQEETAEPKNIKGIIIMVLTAAVLIGGTAVLYLKGVFMENGVLKPEYLGGAALAVFGTLFVMYRELFVNKKEKKSKENKQETNDTVKKPEKPINGFPPIKKTPVNTVKKQEPKEIKNVGKTAGNKTKGSPKPSKPPIKPRPTNMQRSVMNNENVGRDIYGYEKNAENVYGQVNNAENVYEHGNSAENIYGQVSNAENIYRHGNNAENIYEQVSNNIPNPIENSMDEYESGFDDASDTVIIQDNSNRAYLEYFDNGMSSKFYIDSDEIIVGKQKSRVNYSIPNNTVSKVHACFGRDEKGYYAMDLKSTNGTFINDSGRLVSNMKYYINNGDIIKLARIELEFHC